jgi:hypothetical protein
MDATPQPEVPMVDLFYLTFNAGKEPISVPVFGKHICKALRNSGNGGAAALPELLAM